MNSIRNGRIKKAIFAGLFFGTMMGIFYSIMQEEVALVSALLSGILFGVSIYFFSNSKQFEEQTQINVDENEVVYADFANHFVNFESVGGKLYLLGDKLIFKSHLANLQNHQLDIELKAVKSVAFFSTLGIIPNGLKIETHDKVEKFIVNNRKSWKILIDENVRSIMAAR